jgi:hypothetical protein
MEEVQSRRPAVFVDSAVVAGVKLRWCQSAAIQHTRMDAEPPRGSARTLVGSRGWSGISLAAIKSTLTLTLLIIKINQ